MLSPEVRTYMERFEALERARSAYDAARRHRSRRADLASLTNDLRIADGQVSEAMALCIPDGEVVSLETVRTHIFIPLLAEELGGSIDAAKVAWALGLRPAFLHPQASSRLE